VGWGERFIGKERVREGVSEFFTKFPDGRLSDGHHFISGNRGSTSTTAYLFTQRLLQIERERKETNRFHQSWTERVVALHVRCKPSSAIHSTTAVEVFALRRSVQGRKSPLGGYG
jgi:hypothetical protein